jgi:hypothetical protein
VNAFRRSDIDLRPRVFTLSNVISNVECRYFVGSFDIGLDSRNSIRSCTKGW